MREDRVDPRVLLVSLAVLAWLVAAPAMAQRIDGLPRASQKQVITQTVGVSEVTIAYHRPQVRGRTIWGALVPFDHEEALEWADRALSMAENFDTLSTKAGLLAQMGRTEEALELAEKSAAYGNEQQINVLGYQFLGRGEIDKAIEIFAKNTSDHPDSWNVWDSLGEAQAQKGLAKEAIASYSKALEMAPDTQKPRIAEILKGLEGQ